VVIASTAPSPRAIPPEEIARIAEEMGAKAIVEPDIGGAIERAKRLAGPTDAVLVTGSLWFIGAARSHLVR
jgi:dihydrofolate synthase/folylpolyglutamate synthase